tara:strand:+ start:896 stop:1111 length:216 start_codon:yes stop_codon:yes gene_type:complete
MTTIEKILRAHGIMTTQEFKNSIKKELQETEEMFQMGLLTPQERFKRDLDSKRRLNSWYKLSRAGKYKDVA